MNSRAVALCSQPVRPPRGPHPLLQMSTSGDPNPRGFAACDQEGFQEGRDMKPAYRKANNVRYDALKDGRLEEQELDRALIACSPVVKCTF